MALVLLLAGRAASGGPPSEPILRIEARMHVDKITRIAADAAGRWLVTASSDKTARVWDVQTGDLLRVLRPPIGIDASEGMLFAIALSPNGQNVACAGIDWEGSGSIYLFERATGRMIHRLSSLSNAINHLAWSHDGQFLAATLAGPNGLRVWRTSNGSLVGEDNDYDNMSLGADFSLDGQLATTCYDGSVRLYDTSFRRVALVQPRGGKRPRSITWSPDGSKVAVGFWLSTAINVLSGHDLSFQFAPDTETVDNGNLTSVAFSTDGRTLYAGGEWQVNGMRPIRAWPQGGRGKPIDFPACENSLMDLVARPEGGVFFGAHDPACGYLDASGRVTTFQKPTAADMRGQRGAFGVSAEGSRVMFGYEYGGKSPAVFSVAERSLTFGGSTNGLTLPRTNAPGLQVTDWISNRVPKLNGATIEIGQYEVSRSLVVSRNGHSFVLGTESYLFHLDSAGKKLWKISAPGIAWAVNISGNGQLLLAAFADGTIRWYRLRDGQELLAFFPHADRKRWVVWTPEGYYDCSSGGEDLIGWHVNNGEDAAADFFPASRFRATRYRPDVIVKLLDTLDTNAALRLANEEAGPRAQPSQPANASAVVQASTRATELRHCFPPVVTILAPTDNAAFNSAEVTVRYAVRTPSGEPVTRVRALVDGRPIEAVRGFKVPPAGATSIEHEIFLRLPGRDCEVAIIAENRIIASEPSRVRLKWIAPPEVALGEGAFKPKLYVLAVGVSKYAIDQLQLQFASKDAADFTSAIQAQKGGLYADVIVRMLTDADATRDNIMDDLEWLERQTTSKDLGILFLAGHAITDPNGTFYFLPQNADPEKLKRTCVSFADVQSTLRNLVGKALFFVDACHSGGLMGRQVSGGTRRDGTVDVTRLVNELSTAENGVVVFASSTGRQYSLENSSWGNGAFTKALVEGLSGKADMTNRGKITVASLDFYLAERVKELTEGKQTPVTTKPDTVPDFPIALVK